MDFVEKIDQKLKEKNLKRISLCDDLGITHSALTDWKKRGTIPSGDVCIKIAEYLGVSVEWLVRGTERAAEKEEYNKEEKMLIGKIRDLTPQQRESIDILLDGYTMANMEEFKKVSV